MEFKASVLYLGLTPPLFSFSYSQLVFIIMAIRTRRVLRRSARRKLHFLQIFELHDMQPSRMNSLLCVWMFAVAEQCARSRTDSTQKQASAQSASHSNSRRCRRVERKVRSSRYRAKLVVSLVHSLLLSDVPPL